MTAERGHEQTRIGLHRAAVRWVMLECWRRGIRFHRGTRVVGDLVLEPKGLAVRVKVARQFPRRHDIKAGGKVYHYRYLTSFFNCGAHGHGHRLKPAFLVFVEVPGHAVWVVPSRVLGGVQTFTVHHGQKRRGSRLDRYRERWDLLGGKVAA